ncbi:hypothetical protein Ancab_008204 [Ancistrocladus abbreviatus]
MASKDPEENGNTETEEETIALQKKRARRVSFAETTAIHVFDRDEEYETPPGLEPSSAGDQLFGQSSDEVVGLRRSESDDIKALLQIDGEEADGGGDEDDDDEESATKSFLRPFESPSSGSNIGSATSYEEDNFFGPVSADFIKPGRLSGSAASDEHRDITMDSAAFSMHFRSLARSDSGGEFKTPTAVCLSFGERTPSQTTTSATFGNMMALTGTKKPGTQSSLRISKVTDGGDSNDMSLVGTNPNRYDYGKLSPELDALLAEGSDVVQPILLSNYVEGLNSSPRLRKENLSPKFGQNGSEKKDREDDRDASIGAYVDVLKGMPFFEYKESMMDVKEASGRLLESPKMTTQTNLNHEQLSGSPLRSSISSLYAKRREIFRDAVNSSSHHLSLTYSEKRPDYFQSKESVRSFRSLSSFEKSVSRLKKLDAFPFASASKVGVNTSRIPVMKYFSESPSKNRSNDGKSSTDNIGNLDAPVACLEEQFLDVAGADGEEKSSSKMEGDGSMVPENGECSKSSEEVNDIVQNRGLSHPSIDLPLQDKFGGMVVATVPSHTTFSGKKGLTDPLSVNHGEGKLCSSETSPLEITLNVKYEKEAEKSDDYPFPREKGLEMKVTEPLGYQGSLVMSPKQMECLVLGQDRNPTEGTNGVCHSISKTEKYSSLFVGKSADSRLASFEIDKLQENGRYDKLVMLSSPQSNSGASGFSWSVEDSRSGKLDDLSPILQTGRSPIRSVKNHLLQQTEASSIESLVHEVSEGPSTLELSHGQSKEGLGNLAYVNDVHLLVGTDFPTSKPNHPSMKHDGNDLPQGSHVLRKPLDVHGGDSCFKLKRKFGELVRGTEEDADEIASFLPSAKFHKDQNHGIESQRSPSGTRSIGGARTPIHWTDMFSRFCGATKKLLSPDIENLDLQVLGKLENIFVHLQKVKACEVLYSDLISQRRFDNVDYSGSKRVADAKLLHFKTIYRMARLQLMRLKVDKLLGKVRLLRSGMQESEILKSKCQHHWHAPGQVKGQVDGRCLLPRSCAVDVEGKYVVPDENVATLRQELEALEKEIKSLTESFHVSFKMKQETHNSETVVFLNNQLKKRACCQNLQRELQLWEVESLETQNGQHAAVLNYGGFIFQRFKINFKHTFSLIISNTLNDSKILKTFPNMDAGIAFSFVLSGETTMRYAGARTFAQETQRTSSRLQNLMDVLGEIELAQMELRTLTQSSFCSPSAGKLDLHLCFTCFNSGGRVTLCLDITCLNWGIYPSDILPYDMQEGAASKEKPLNSQLADIRNALGCLKGGCMRIIRLCRCVSKVLQGSSSTNHGVANPLLDNS